MKTSARLLQIWRQNGCLAYDQAQDILDDLENLSEVEAERDAMSGHLDDLSVCICGCPMDEHENVDEGAESCGNDDHECFRVYPAVLQIVTALRADLAAVTAERDTLLSQRDHAIRDCEDAEGAHDQAGEQCAAALKRVAELEETIAQVKVLKERNAALVARFKMDPVSVVSAAIEFAQEPMECGHNVDCFDEATDTCGYCVALARVAELEQRVEALTEAIEKWRLVFVNPATNVIEQDRADNALSDFYSTFPTAGGSNRREGETMSSDATAISCPECGTFVSRDNLDRYCSRCKELADLRSRVARLTEAIQIEADEHARAAALFDDQGDLGEAPAPYHRVRRGILLSVLPAPQPADPPQGEKGSK